MKDDQIILNPVAYVYNSREEIKDDYWGSVVSEIKLTDDFPAECFDGIETFSHLEIIFYFNKTNQEQKFIYKGHPRGNTDWDEVGIFVQRKKLRPNLIGATIVKLLKRKGKSIFVEMLDAINGTPVFDIKPVLKEFLPTEETHQPKWADELMKSYWAK